MLAKVEEIRAYSHSIQGFTDDAERIEKEVNKIRAILSYEKEERQGEEING
jgi:hypothetical protein